MRAQSRGNALVETIVALVALSPVVSCIVLLGKQLDVKHKTYDALRYSVWERTVWSDTKSSRDITTEAIDRTLGNPAAGLTPLQTLRAEGVSQNPLWKDGKQPLLNDSSSSPIASEHRNESAPTDVGYELVPTLTRGAGPLAAAMRALETDDLGLNDRAFASTRISASLRPMLADTTISMTATGAVLSDTWSSRDEAEFRRRVDNITANEVIERLESPARLLAMQARAKGGPLYGEGQYSFSPDLRPRSNALPRAYVDERRER